MPTEQICVQFNELRCVQLLDHLQARGVGWLLMWIRFRLLEISV